MSLFEELKRRNVFRVAVAYAVVAWVVAQITELAADSFGAPDWVMKMLIVLLALGFPLALFFSWAYEITPEGVKREEEVDVPNPLHISPWTDWRARTRLGLGCVDRRICAGNTR